MKQVTYFPRGTCSRQIDVTLNDDNTIREVRFTGGCNGNTTGISRLVVGMKAEDVIARLKGTHCGPRPTSCPDQLALALERCMAEDA